MTQTKHTAGAFLAIVLSLFMPTFLEAQFTIYATDHTVQPGEEFEVEISVRNFSEIISCQFSIEWNENHLRLKETGNLNSDLQTTFGNFNLSAVDTGQLGFAWFDPNLADLTFEDDTPLFTMEFEVITDQTATDSISFGGVPISVEVADKDENILDVNFEGGTIQIDGISSVLERRGQETLSIVSLPNPFVNSPQVMLNFHRQATAALSLYHPDGQLVYTQPASVFAEGEHNIRLPDEVFTASGIYLLRVHSTDFIITHKMIAQ